MKNHRKLQFDWVAERINRMNNPSVLDVGAGIKYLNTLLNPKVKYKSLDIEGEQTYLSSVEDFYPTGSYDVIVMMDILEHVVNPDAIMDKFKVAGNTFFIALPNEYSWLFRLYHLFGHITKMDEPFQIVNKHLHIHRPRVKDIKAFCNKHLEVQEIDYLWYSDSFPEWFNWIMNKFAKIWPSMFAKEVVVMGVKR